MESDQPQDTRGESNSGDFSQERPEGMPDPVVWPGQSRVKLPPKPPPVLFRHSLTAKLMQKIHRLTDN
jgi:hypothetical protein